MMRFFLTASLTGLVRARHEGFVDAASRGAGSGLYGLC